MYNKIDSQAFTLTMLGTDTFYTPTLKDKKKTSLKKGDKVVDYPKGETLSIVSTLVKTTSEPHVDLKNLSPVPYQSNESVIVNGPKTDGSNVGEKIGLGLGALLNAIARGQIKISITAHSRGAVESVLIGHELNEIKKVIVNCENLDQLLKILSAQQAERLKKKASNTPDFIKVLTDQLPKNKAEQASWFLALKNNVPQTSVNLFAIDPVPGDCFPITWYDDRFYTLPDIITNAEFLYYENEHSDWGFTPIYPESNPHQNVVRHSVPGHHGTGSTGSNGSQQNIVVAPNGYKATHTQKLVIYKLLEFLTKNGVAFKDGKEIFKEHAGLGRKYAKMLADMEIDADTIDVSQLDFPTIYRDLYAKIAENRPAYEAFNATHYTFMGVSPQRKMLRTGHKYGLFTDVFPTHRGYVNEEHGRLMQDYFFKIFKLDAPESLSLSALIDTAHETLEKNIKAITCLTDSSTFFVVGQSAPILDNEQARKDVLSTFGAVIQRVSQQYLTDDWSTEEKKREKQALFTAITSILRKFQELSTTGNLVAKPFVDELIKMGLSGIIQTVGQQHMELEEESDRIQKPTNLKLMQFFNSLVLHINQVERDTGIDPRIQNIVESEEFNLLADYPIAAKIEYIWNRIEKDLPSSETQSDTNILAQLIESFEEQFGDNFEDFEKLYQQNKVFINDLDALIWLTPSEKEVFDKYKLSLLQKQQDLIDTAAQRFYKDRPDELPEIADKGTFRELVERHAINNYGVIDRLKQENQKLKEAQDLLTRQLEEIERQRAELETQKRETEERLNAEKAKNKKYHQFMNDDKEAEYLLLINQQLVPLTKEYLALLRSSIGTDSEKNKKITLKIIKVVELLDCLESTELRPEPLARLKAFYSTLDEAQETLKEHRDPAWVRYSRNAVLAAGILLSGIIPGLIALAIYSNIGKKSLKSPLFWQPIGENVVDTFNGHREKLDLEDGDEVELIIDSALSSGH